MLNLDELLSSAIAAINQASDLASLNDIRLKYLGKKGYLTLQITTIRTMPKENRPIAGTMINEAKEEIQKAIDIRRAILENSTLKARLPQETIDVSLPGRRIEHYGLHPVTRTIDRIKSFFIELSFSIVFGPEIEDDYHNFDALNISKDHPVRTDHDTFWFDSTRLLRTQMSGVQIRTMKKQTPPIRIIAPGRVYRNDYDQTHTPMFHQMEGLIVDKNITFTNLKGTLQDFLCNFFEDNRKMRFRPSYFPFTEPSAEVEVMGENGQWLEVLGCGMIHPNVLKNVDIDSEIYSGFAFGMGIERLTMLRYGIVDLRTFFENDLRFLKQFK